MHLIEITPAPCNNCGRGNTTDSRDPVRFVDFERDVNWNEPLILCEDCIAQAGGMVGMASKDTLQSMRAEVRKAQRETHEIKAEIDGMKRRAKRLGIKFEPVEA